MIFGNLGNMGEMIKMAKEMQGQLKKIKDELARNIYEGASGGVVVKISGDMEVKEVHIPPQLIVENGGPRLEREVLEAFKRALKITKDEAARKMKGLTGGMGLPPGML
ncbi:MAG: YbaB/EbfC family nucleoid-associated protein [Candidatus Margulisiibacteriota bacterium]